MYLLTMDKLWKKRKAPLPLQWHELQKLGETGLLSLSSTKLQVLML